MTDQAMSELRARNALRAEEAKKKMGESWACHPAKAATVKKYKKQLRIARKICS
jgi:hypothetical protein